MSDLPNVNAKKWIKLGIGVVLIIVFLSSLGNILETNDEGFFQIKQAIWSGDMTVRIAPGTYFQNFGSIYDYKQVATIGIGDQVGEGSADVPAVKVIFNDGSKADISALVRVQLPRTDEQILNLKKEFSGGFDHFIRSGIVPIVENAIKLSANLRSAQDAYTTLALFQQAIEDQLRNGIYVTRSDKIIITRSTGDVEEQKITAVVLDENGDPKRMQNRFSELGCEVKECVISMPSFDPKVEEMIAARKDEAMKTELAKQEAIRAKQDAITAEEKGKANVATAKYEKEVELIKATTKAREKYEVAQFSAKEALEEKKKKISLAEGVKQELLIADGLSARAKYQIDANVKRDIGVAEHMSKWVGPQIVAGGAGTGDGNGGGGVENALMIKMFMDMIKK